MCDGNTSVTKLRIHKSNLRWVIECMEINVVITCIYAIVNNINGRRYVGQAVDLRVRVGIHRRSLRRGSHHSIILQRAYNKYGEASFNLEILEECSVDQLDEREQFYIDSFNSSGRNGYNISPTAGSPLGVKHTDETKAKVSAALIGKKKTAEHSANIKAGKQNVTAETRAKQSNYAKNRSPEHRRRLSEAIKGKKRGNGLRSDNRFIEYNGKRLTVAQWAKLLGLKSGTILNRLNKGWVVGRVLEIVDQRSVKSDETKRKMSDAAKRHHLNVGTDYISHTLKEKYKDPLFYYKYLKHRRFKNGSSLIEKRVERLFRKRFPSSAYPPVKSIEQEMENSYD